MKMLRAATLCFTFLALSAQASPAKYVEGQVWEYRTRPQDAGSLLKIQKIGSDATGKVYHLSVIRVHFSAPGIAGVLPHIPVSDVTLDASVTKLSSTNPEFPTTALQEGIAEWERARGGVFTIPVSQIVNIVDDQIRQAQEPPRAPSPKL